MELTGRVRTVLKHGRFVNGPEVREFEHAMSEYVGVEHAVAVGSGTDALIFALMALGFGGFTDDGTILPTWVTGPFLPSKVAVPAFTFSATAAAVAAAGAYISFVDIREEDFGIDVNTIDNAESLDAIVAVDMFGIPCNWDSIIDFCSSNKIDLIEDSAQSIGAKYKGVKCGGFGFSGCTSFYPSKPLSCAGDGGMVLTDDTEIANKVRMMANHGRLSDNRYSAEIIGRNSRLDTIQAAVLLDRLQAFESREIPCRIAQASDYYDKLSSGKHYEPNPGREPIWSWYPVLFDNKKERDEAFQDYGGYVGARIIYPTPLHLMPAFKYLGYKQGDFPVAESICERILAFPIVHHWEINKCLATIMSAESASIVLRS